VADLPDVEVVPLHRQVSLWLMGLAAFATMPLDESYLGTVLAFAEVERGFDPAAAAFLGVAFVVGGAVVFTTLAGVVARTPMHRLLIVAGVGSSLVMALAAAGPGWVLIPVGLVHAALLDATWLALQAMVLRANPGREGATKLVVELLETVSFVVVFGLGVLADRVGLGGAMWAYALVPLLLLPVAGSMRRLSAASRASDRPDTDGDPADDR
jgi:hypothetical protein